MPEPKVISFYSFKGGAGRTVCTANFAGTYARHIKATPERPILLMDMDLDSAGLTILLILIFAIFSDGVKRSQP